MSRPQSEQNILNAIYAGAAKECEEREHDLASKPGIRIHGHHMAQAIVKNVEAELVRVGIFKPVTE